MSKSRLEKFLYAIYTLDYSDLPKPLSRIEELYNCWATGGEVPTFTPLSRVEKYLMAILGNYDISELPEPLSRVEVLLHKLVMGDDNLEEIKSFLSRHEELLAGIIRNGGFSGSDDFYHTVTSLAYAHNTLYYTTEEPVKSAILTGETLVNVDSYYTSDDFVNSHISAITDDFYIQLVANGEWRNSFTKLKSSIKPNTKYLAIVEIKENTLDGSFTLFSQHNVESAFSGQAKTLSSGTTGIFKCILTSISEFDSTTNVCLRNYINNNTTSGNIKFRTMLIEYQEGMENWDIPYFTGMQSVKMPVLKATGKNLFDGKGLVCGSNYYTSYDFYNPHIREGNRATLLVEDLISVTGGSTLTLSFSTSFNGVIQEYGYNSCRIKDNDEGWFTSTQTLNLNQNTKMVNIYFRKTDDSKFTSNDLQELLNSIQLEESSTATSYEPFKSNILTVNEDVTLRGIGDVRDELDLLTGELTQRIGEIVLDGTENIRLQAELGEVNRYFFNIKTPNVTWTNYQLSNYLLFNGTDFLGDYEHFYLDGDGNVMLFAKNKTVNELQERLKQNNLTIQYHLATESLKTVDLSVVDQDGNDTKLKTFEDITHVILSSGGLIPTGEMEVAMQIQHVIYNLANSLNTLYNTLDRSPKNAILKGNTLVNLTTDSGSYELAKHSTVTSDYITVDTKTAKEIKFTVLQDTSSWVYLTVDINLSMLKPNTEYLIVGDLMVGIRYARICRGDSTNNLEQTPYPYFNGNNFVKITTNDLSNNTYKDIRLYLRPNELKAGDVVHIKNVRLIEYQEGMENWDIPYFEGMKSVQMPVLKATGKNLFNPDMLILGGNNYGIAQYSPDTSNLTRALLKQNNLIEVKPNSTLTLSCDSRFKLVIQEYDENEIRTMQYDSGWQTNGYHSLTVSANTKKVNLYFVKQDPYTLTDITSEEFEVLKNSIQLEENSTVTPYEPYKSSILTVNEDVELRGVGDVKDELNVLTGELTQRISEIVLDGSESWEYHLQTNTDTIAYRTPVTGTSPYSPVLCDSFINQTGAADKEHCFIGVSNIAVFINRSRLSTVNITGFREYLQSNPLTIQYRLANESIKTVELSVVDQDGNDTKLKTFEDITHVILSSGGLIPTGEMEVATKNLGDINNTVAMSLRMNDISSTQETLEEVSDAQSESIDATMMATTEVYEQIL